MFILSKKGVNTFNPMVKRGKYYTSSPKSITTRQKDGITTAKIVKLNPEVIIGNVWRITSGYLKTTKDKYAYEHTAMFPEELAEMHIRSWSNINDVVFDPFCGSGTTCKMAKILNRQFLGCDISDDYIKIAKKRIDSAIVRVDDYGFEGIDAWEVDE